MRLLHFYLGLLPPDSMTSLLYGLGFFAVVMLIVAAIASDKVLA